MVEAASLPPLRQEIDLFPAPPSTDGSPAWTLHDPAINRYYLLGWPAFEILSRWRLGYFQAVCDAVNRETTLELTEADILDVVKFLEQHFLLDMVSPLATGRLTTFRRAKKPGIATWLLHNYLFLRIPLIKPQLFLDALGPGLAWIYTRSFLAICLMATIGALSLVSRQWDTFVHSFTAYRGWDGLIAMGCVIPLAKVIHEFGHAFTAHRFGCRIPTMGLAFVVMTPMLYTDTNEAWKLTSRRQRMAIGVAGITAELLLALAASWAWLMLPEGPWRGAAFILATTTWFMTIALNASPFMRFDGYFILSDFLGLANLHARSFAFGRWWMRERLFALGDHQPEPASVNRRRFLVAFAYTVWVYRLSVFLGIAMLVYHYFFKTLGIFLFVVEIGWFVLLPFYREAVAWWRIRERLHLNIATIRSLLLLLTMMTVLSVPWRSRVSAPALLLAAHEQHISTPRPSMVKEIAPESGIVHKGDVLIRLESPDVEHQIKQVRTSLAVSLWQASRQSFDQTLLSQGKAPQRRYEGNSIEYAGLQEERGRLTVHAPFDGVIVARNDDLSLGMWLAGKELLYIIADTSRNRIEAYVGEQDINRFQAGASARFIPDAIEYGAFTCKVSDMDRVNVTVIDNPMLASASGGPLASRPDPHGSQIPQSPVFRVRLDGCSPETVQLIPLRGVVHIDAERESLLQEWIKHTIAFLVRESSL